MRMDSDLFLMPEDPDERERETGQEMEEEIENPNEIPTTNAVSSDLPPVPEDDEDDWNIRPGIFDGEEGKEEDAEVDANRGVETSSHLCLHAMRDPVQRLLSLVNRRAKEELP